MNIKTGRKVLQKWQVFLEGRTFDITDLDEVMQIMGGEMYTNPTNELYVILHPFHCELWERITLPNKNMIIAAAVEALQSCPQYDEYKALLIARL